MKVSVLIPAFHADPFIHAALESVRAQTHENWELIVVEDGSHDDTERIVAAFAARCPQRVIYDNLGENFGVATARNRLMELASGDVFAFLDADDAWSPTHLADAMALMDMGADIVVGGVRTFDLVRNRVMATYSPPAALMRDPVLTLFQGNVIPTSSMVVMARDLAERAGRFDPTLRIGEDRDYWLRCALADGRFKIAPGYSCDCARHLAASRARTYVVAQHMARFYEKYRRLSRVPERLRRHLLAESLLCLGRLLRQYDQQRSAAFLWRAWRYEPFNVFIPAHLAFTAWRSVATTHAHAAA
jgi:glycosyltransferase involved in cell wall biosynthesis